jgi:hypothetical protein
VCVGTPNVPDISDLDFPMKIRCPLHVVGGLLTEKWPWIFFDLESGWNRELVVCPAQDM